MNGYFLAWVVAVAIQRITANKNTHSRYDGKPFIGMLVTKNQERARFIVEPLVCLGVGFYLLELSDVLGKLIMSSALSLMFIDRSGKHADDIKMQQVLDSRLEAQYLSEGVRKHRGLNNFPIFRLGGWLDDVIPQR